MRVLFVSSSSGSRGGGEIYMLYLGRALSRRGHEVVYWLSDHGMMDELASELCTAGEVVRSGYLNTYLRPLRSLGSLWDGMAARRIREGWRAYGCDLIHLNKQNLEDGLDLVAAAEGSGVPRVATIHLTQSASYLGAKSAWLRDWVARRRLARFSGVFVTVQEKRAEDLGAFLGGAAPGSGRSTTG